MDQLTRSAATDIARDHLDRVEQDADRPDVQVRLYGSTDAYDNAYAEAARTFFTLNMRSSTEAEIAAAIEVAAKFL